MSSVDHFLQLEKCCGLMTTNITQVIWASATKRKRFGIFYFLYVNFIEGAITVILHAEYCRAKQIIIFYQFHKSNSVNFFSAPDHFISSMSINIFDQVR